jgi:hypothetical protein
MRERGISGNDPEIEQYARTNGLSYEVAAHQMYYSGGGGAQPEEQPTDEDPFAGLIETITKDVVPQALEFDVEAARRAAEQEWGPYMDELLQDYLTEVEIGRQREAENLATSLETLGLGGTRTAEDLATVLEQYGTTGTRAQEDTVRLLDLLGGRRGEFLEKIERESPLIQEAIGGRAADRGMFFSGQREEEQRRQLEAVQRAREAYEREYAYQVGGAETGLARKQEDIQRGTAQAQQGAGRTQEDIARQEEARRLEGQRYLADIDREKRKRERDLAREREAAITGQIETFREEKLGGFS